MSPNGCSDKVNSSICSSFSGLYGLLREICDSGIVKCSPQFNTHYSPHLLDLGTMYVVKGFGAENVESCKNTL